MICLNNINLSTTFLTPYCIDIHPIIFCSTYTDAVDKLSNHYCNRECNGEPMRCNYTLIIETYSTMSKACHHFLDSGKELESVPEDCAIADGVPRRIYAVNRTLPSPQIRVGFKYKF